MAQYDFTKAEDSASASGDKAYPILGVRNDADATLTSNDGDYGHIAIDSTGKVKVAGTLTVSGTVDTELPAAATLADNTSNPTVPGVASFLMAFDGTNWDRVQTGGATGGALKIDGSASVQPVSGTVTANAGIGTFTISGSVVATNAGTFAVQESGAALTSLQLIDDIVVSPGTALGSTKVALMAGSVTTAAPTFTTGQINQLSLTTSGALRVDVGATSANATAIKVDGSAVTQPVSGTVTANQGGSPWQVQSNSLSIATEATLAKLTQTQASTTSGQSGPLVQGATTASAPTYSVNTTNPLSLTVNGALRVDGSAVTQPISNTGLTSLAAALRNEDSISASLDVGMPALILRKDTPATLSDNDGDYEFPQMSAGRLWTSTVVTGTPSVDTELPAAAALTDATTNPTAPAVGAFMLAWNGSTWDRVQVGPSGLKVDPSTSAVTSVAVQNQVVIDPISNLLDRDTFMRFMTGLRGTAAMAGSYANINRSEWSFSTAQTDTALVTPPQGQKIIVLAASVIISAATTVNVAARLGFGTSTLPSTATTEVAGIVLSAGSIPPGSGVIEGNGAGVIAAGKDSQVLRLTCGAATSGNIRVVVTYYFVPSSY